VFKCICAILAEFISLCPYRKVGRRNNFLVRRMELAKHFIRKI